MIGAGYLAITALLAFANIVIWKKKRVANRLINVHRYLTFFALGFTLSFFLHFLLYKNIITAGAYLAFDFKMLFIRRHNWGKLNDLMVYLDPTAHYEMYTLEVWYTPEQGADLPLTGFGLNCFIFIVAPAFG